MNVVSNDCSLKWMWSQMIEDSNECGLKWTWFQMNVVLNECGLKRTGLKWMWSQMNVVSNEQVWYECGLKWSGLKCRGLRWMVSNELVSIVCTPFTSVLEILSTVDSKFKGIITSWDVTFLLDRFFKENERNHAQTSGKRYNPDTMHIYHSQLCQHTTAVMSMHWNQSINFHAWFKTFRFSKKRMPLLAKWPRGQQVSQT